MEKQRKSLLSRRGSAEKSTEKRKNSENHCYQDAVALKKALKNEKIAKIIAFRTQ